MNISNYIRTSIGLGVMTLAVSAYSQTTVRVSLSDLEAQANAASVQQSISADGRYVTFTSNATNLLSFVTTNIQVYKRDLQLGTTTLVSGYDALSQANGDCSNPRISADGRYVIFSSFATNLDGIDGNGVRDVFVRDTWAGGIITRVSLGDDESEGNAGSDSGWLSENGRASFRSDATNLVSGGTTGSQVFVRDLVAGTTVLVSREDGANGAQGDGYSGLQPCITPDGRYVGFSSSSTNLVAGDTNGSFDAFVRDTQTHTNRRISLAINGLQGWQDSYNCSISDDGRYVAFVSNQGFVNGDSNGLHDVFVRDVVANTMVRASVDSQGKQTTGGASGGTGVVAGWGMRISGNGRYVVFQSLATNLIKGDNNGVEDVFIRDLVANTTKMVSLNTSGKPANGASTIPTISGNGAYVSFLSTATNLITGDTNGVMDVFRRGAY
ncbi:MAG: hypothetical protein K1X67_14310 [Fimbriimonadaceae bacterium]|nr:hypothetical protein [Fimbriimonadaceae bacterium]